MKAKCPLDLPKHAFARVIEVSNGVACAGMFWAPMIGRPIGWKIEDLPGPEVAGKVLGLNRLPTIVEDPVIWPGK